MADFIGQPPAEKLIPVTKGCDRSFTIQRVDQSGAAVNFGSGTTVYIDIDIDKANPTRVNAVVSGSMAAFHIQSTVLDLCKSGTRWRVIFDQGDLEIPLLVGKFGRYDG